MKMIIRKFCYLFLLCLSCPSSAAGVLVYGDSISAGYGISAGQGWVDLLSQRLQQRTPQIEVVNASASGETTQGGVTRIRDVLQRHRPDVMILELGGNDALRGLALNRTKENLAAIISLARDSGVDVLLLGMQIPPNFGPLFTKRFEALYQELQNELNVALVPNFLQEVALSAELMQADKIHPTAAAQILLLDKLWPELQILLDDGA